MHFNKNNNELKKHIQGLRKFKFTIPKNVKKIINKRGSIFYDILQKWDYLVGEKIASAAYPTSISIGSEGRIKSLKLAIKKGDEVLIEYSKKEIMDRLNSYFGYNAINNIRIEQVIKNKKPFKGNKQQKYNKLDEEYHNKIAKIKSKNIRDALLELMHIIKK